MESPADGTAQDTQHVKPHLRGPIRLRLLAFLLIVLVVVPLGIKYFWFSRPEGSGPVDIDVAREPFDNTWSERDVLLLGVGDSVTDGFGARLGHGYFDMLVANPEDDFPEMRGINLTAVLPNLQARNDAVSGSTSIDHLDRLLAQLEPQPAKTLGIVVMTTGGNDIIHNYGRTPPCEGAMYGATLAQAQPWIKSFDARLRSMVTHIEDAFPGGCHIFLANIYDPTDGVGDAPNAGLPPFPDALAILGAYNAVIARCAAEHDSVHLVDIHGPFLGHGIHCTQVWRKHYRWSDPHYWYYYNLEDPNERGYDAIRRLFLNAIAGVLGQLAPTGSTAGT